MIDLSALLENTGAFCAVKGDKENGRLSHAYLILTADGDKLSEFLKIFAKLMVCKEGSPCGKCRSCRLIENGSFADVYQYPENGSSVTTEDVNELIEESYLKPVESDKKIFILNHAETMTAPAQNKLLKTLEEPPENVHIVLGATNEYSILPTVKSRVKKLEIPAFGDDLLINALSGDCPDTERLKEAVACGDGTVGKALALYGDEKLHGLTELVTDMLINMKSSKDILKYSLKIGSLGGDLSDFLSVLELLLRDMLVDLQGKNEFVTNKKALEKLKRAERFNTGAIIHALECVTRANERKRFNANATMLIEWLLFQILEGKYKWQKL